MADTLTLDGDDAQDVSSITHIRHGNALGLGSVRIGIAPDASAEDLLNDAACLLGAGAEAFCAMTDSACSEEAPQEIADAWYAAVYTLKAGLAVFSEAHERVSAELRRVKREDGK